MEKRFYEKLVEYDFREPCALCTVMEWKGSVPRKDYPMMLVCKSGTTIGTIGGGAMEKEVIDLAGTALESGQTLLESFSFVNDDLTHDGGLCGGTVKVAIEPYTKEIQLFWKALKANGSHQTWLTTFDFQNKDITRQVITSQFHIHDSRLKGLVVGGKSRTILTEDAIHLYRHVAPDPVLHIFGGGHVGKAVADLAYFIEMDITIHDDRAFFASAERFPHALSRSHEPLATFMGKVRLHSSDLALVVTRGHRHDLAIIRWLLHSQADWIGLVSSRRKWKILSQGLREEGFTETDIARVQAPVGLDIKAQTVPEIAVSIIGGIIQHMRQTHHE